MAKEISRRRKNLSERLESAQIPLDALGFPDFEEVCGSRLAVVEEERELTIKGELLYITQLSLAECLNRIETIAQTLGPGSWTIYPDDKYVGALVFESWPGKIPFEILCSVIRDGFIVEHNAQFIASIDMDGSRDDPECILYLRKVG